MNPAMIQALAADRNSNLQDQATAWRSAGQIRRPRPARHPRPLLRIRQAGRGPDSLADPRTA
jgi:hypothetical protein